MLAQQGKQGESLLPLTRLFRPGQLVRCVVTGLRTGAAAEPEPRAPAGQKRKRGAPQKLIELSLEVARVCAGAAADQGLREGTALPTCVRSVEDHGYTLLLGPQGAEGECASLPSSMLSLHFIQLSVSQWSSGAEGASFLGSSAYLRHSYGWLHTLCTGACCYGAPEGVHLCSNHPPPLLYLEHDGNRLHPRMICNVRDDDRQRSSVPGGKVKKLEILDGTLLTIMKWKTSLLQEGACGKLLWEHYEAACANKVLAAAHEL